MSTTFRHIERSGAVRVALPVAEAFFYFTPEGERTYEPGWAPEYFHPAAGTDCEGAVFRTSAGGEETLWLIARFDPDAGAAEYVRVVPGSRLGTVTIVSEADGAAATVVHVTYRMTALSAEGNRALEAFAAGFDDMLRQWQSAIAARVGTAGRQSL